MFGENENGVWANPEMGVIGARLSKDKTVLANLICKLELNNPYSVSRNFMFAPNGGLAMEERVMGSDCAVDVKNPAVWFWNKSGHNVRLGKHQCIGSLHECDVLEENFVGMKTR